MTVKSIDHVQLAMPPGGEEEARAFYVGLLNFTEVPKPDVMAGRGGAWFEAGEARVHLGAEADFRPARKAHPAFVVDDLDRLERALAAAGYPIRPDVPVMGFKRFSSEDCFGNRLEFMQVTA